MKPTGLQERFLNAIRKQRIPATLYLINGFQMKGLIKAFDDYTVILLCGDTQEMVFKHAISTIIPARTIELDIPALDAE